jgi:UDP-N-acetylglucosamine--dolichyl-phosphate N-acetylglucosaminephosphotransferase
MTRKEKIEGSFNMFSLEIVAIAIFAIILSGILARFLVPWIISASLRQNITTVDAHKKGKPIIAEPGGLAPLLGFIFTILIILFIWEYINPESEINEPLFAGLLSVVIAGLIGFLDDVFKIKWREKVLLGFLPAIPLMALSVGTSTVDFGMFGILDFGSIITFPNGEFINLYTLVIIPLAVNFAFNSFNMLAGFNGLEAGNGAISLAIILAIALYLDNSIVTLFTASLLGGYLVLLRYNWFPAKTLIGDVGTLTLGTGIIVALIIGNMDRLAVGLFGLHFINFLLFVIYLLTKQEAKLATIDDNGDIVAPCPYTAYWIIPYFFKKINEQKNVIILLIIHAAISLSVLILSLPAYSP